MALNNPFVVRTLSRAKFEILRISRAVSNHRGVSLLALLLLFVAGAIAPLVGQQKAQRRSRENERDSAALIRKRADWFFKQRATSRGFIPAGARIRAFQQMEQMRRTQGTLMDGFIAKERTAPQSFGTIPPLSQSTWVSIGPQPTNEPNFFNLTSGRVNAISVDPCDTTGNTVYIGGAQGGMWITRDGGANWTALTDSQPSLAIGSLALDPNPAHCPGGAATSGGHSSAVYVGTGEENFSFDSFYGAGVLKCVVNTTVSPITASCTQDTTFVPSSAPQSQDFGGPFIGSLVVDPATSGSTQVLLAGIQGVSNSIHSGVYRSTDGGNTWLKVLPASSGTFDYGTGVAFDPGDSTGQTAYAVLGVPFTTGNGLEASNGLWKSINGGSVWTRVTSLDNAATSAGLSTASYGRMTLAVAPGNPPSTSNTTIVVAIADIATSSSNLLGTFISTNSGTSFAPLSAGNSNAFCNQQCFYDISVGLDPNPSNPSTPFLFLGGGPNAGGSSSPVAGLSSVIFSNNGGATFFDVSEASAPAFLPVIHVDTHAFAFAHPSGGGTIVYVGNDGGVWSSSNVESSPGSQTWNDLNTNLSLTQFYPGNSIHPSNPQIAFAGAQDNGTQKFDPKFNTSNPQETENVEPCGDGGWTAIDPTTPSTVYAACEDLGVVGQNPVINKNQLDGEPGTTSTLLAPNWIALDTPAMDADIANFVPPFVVDPTNPQNTYFATCRVWQSTNGGVSWSDISGSLDGTVAKGSLTTNCSGSLDITTMSVAPSDSNTVYVGAESPQSTGGIISSLWATSTALTCATSTNQCFTPFDKPGTTPSDRVVTQIAASPANSRVSYVTYSGFSSCGSANGCDGLGHVFKIDCTTACTYTNITSNLPDVPVNDIVLDPNDNTNNTIYIATDVGVFGTTNGGTSWNVFPTGGASGNGLPHVECTSLKLNNTARVLLVGTHGRGDWELQLPGLPSLALTGISPTSATAGGSNFTLTLNGAGFTSTSSVNFNGSQVTGALCSSVTQQCTAPITTGMIGNTGVVSVTVANGATASNSLNFSIEGPLPSLSSVSPMSSTGSANPVTVTVSGSNFTANTGLTWTPTSGSQNGNTTLLAQNAGSLMGSGSSMSFTVTVPATLLQSTLAHIVPVAPSRRRGPDPKYWLLAAFFAAVAGILLFAFVQRKRRLIFGATLATVVFLLSIAGCGGGSGNPPPPGAVIVVVNAYTPGPGGGLSAATASFTANP